MTPTHKGVQFERAHTVKWVQIAGMCVAAFLSGGTGVVSTTMLTGYRIEQLEKVNEHQQAEIEKMRSDQQVELEATRGQQCAENAALRNDIHALDMKIERLIGKIEK